MATSSTKSRRRMLGYVVIALVVIVALLFLAWPRTSDRLTDTPDVPATETP